MEYSKLLADFTSEFSNNELEAVQMTLEHYSLVPKAPTVLRDSILEMTEVLLRVKKGKHDVKTLEMYERWLGAMNMAFAFINDLAKVQQENVTLKDTSDLHYTLYKRALAKLNQYEILEQLVLSDKLEEKLLVIKKKIAENGK